MVYWTSDELVVISETRREETMIQGEILHISPDHFRNTAFIKYQIPNEKFQVNAKDQISLKIYNSSGQLVKTSVNESKGPGVYRIYWDGKNNDGRQLPNGVYFIELKAGDFTKIIKTVMLK